MPLKGSLPSSGFGTTCDLLETHRRDLSGLPLFPNFSKHKSHLESLFKRSLVVSQRFRSGEFAFLMSSMVTLPRQLLYRTPLEQCGGSRSLFLLFRFISSDIKLSCFQLQITEIGLNNKGNLSPPTNCSSEV